MDKNSFITSTDKYLYGMSKLARYDKKTLKDMFLLSIIGTLQDWGCWYDLDEGSFSKLEELSECIILNNPDLELFSPQSFDYYTNVNTPQTSYSWRRMFDNCNTSNIDEVETDYMQMEDSSYSNQETGGRINKEPKNNCE